MHTTNQATTPSHNPALTVQPLVSHRRDTEWFQAIPGERLSIRVLSASVGGQFSILESYSAPGTATPIHTHLEDEVFHILSGAPTFMIGGEIFESAPGSIIVIPAGTPHGWKNRTREEAHMLAIFRPGGVEELFTRIAGLAPDDIARVAAEYGSVVVGPPIE